MNTQHLQYIIEIERTRSISQAAENLFIGQPNLSRILHDVEQMLGFRIFERSTRGVRPTTRGTIFLQHAKSILRETEAIEAPRSFCSTQSPSCARRRPLKRWGPSGPWRTGCACASRARRPCWI